MKKRKKKSKTTSAYEINKKRILSPINKKKSDDNEPYVIYSIFENLNYNPYI